MDFQGTPAQIEWFKSRPPSIQAAIMEKDFRKFYRLKSSGHVVYIMSYVEPNAGPHQCDICKAGALPGHGHHTWDGPTVSVGIEFKYNPGLGFERRVFGIPLDDLEEIPAP